MRKLSDIPNFPLDEVPDGKDEKDNVEHHRFGAKTGVLIHAETAFRSWRSSQTNGISRLPPEALRAARFVVLKKGSSRGLERALGQFFPRCAHE